MPTIVGILTFRILTYPMLGWLEHAKTFINSGLRQGIKYPDGVYIMLINVEMPTTVGILTFMSLINR